MPQLLSRYLHHLQQEAQAVAPSFPQPSLQPPQPHTYVIEIHSRDPIFRTPNQDLDPGHHSGQLLLTLHGSEGASPLLELGASTALAPGLPLFDAGTPVHRFKVRLL
jgi:hypothetical protein